jgi:redox-sensitive bicupin YhaK (pirin superfamily)
VSFATEIVVVLQLAKAVQYGPFVMATREEIEQAVRDYQAGTFTA